MGDTSWTVPTPLVDCHHDCNLDSPLREEFRRADNLHLQIRDEGGDSKVGVVYCCANNCVAICRDGDEKEYADVKKRREEDAAGMANFERRVIYCMGSV